MPEEYIKIGKDNYRHFYTYTDKTKAKKSAEKLRTEGKLVRVLKKVHKMNIGLEEVWIRPKEIVYRVYYCTSRRR